MVCYEASTATVDEPKNTDGCDSSLARYTVDIPMGTPHKRRNDAAVSRSPSLAKKPRRMAKERLFEKDKPCMSKKERREATRRRKMQKNRNYSVIADITSVWERLRPKEVSDHQRQQLLSLAMSRVKGHMVELVQNPKASRVLQCCLRYGTASDRQAILDEMHRDLAKLSVSKYGKHLVQRLIARTPGEDFPRLFRLFPAHTPRLLKHPYGTDVINDLYFKCTAAQQHVLMMACYGQRVMAADADAEADECEMREGVEDPSSFEVVFRKADAVRRASALQKMHGLLTVVIEKGLLVNRLVHRLILEFFRSAPAVQVEAMAAALAETGDGLLKMVHTKEGSAVAVAVLRYSDASHRKTTLRAFREYVKETVLDDWGYTVLIMAFRAVDDTKMLRKVLMPGIVEHLKEICMHRYGGCVILDLLHPNCRWYLPEKIDAHLHPRTLEIALAGATSTRIVGASKKEDGVRRQELLCEGEGSLEEALLQLCTTEAGVLLKCRRGSNVLVEVARGAEGGLLDGDRVRDVHRAIVDACADETFLSDRISKGAIVRIVHASTLDENGGAAKAFCKALWKGVFRGRCQKWIEAKTLSIVVALMTCGSASVRSACRREVQALLTGQSVEEWLEGIREGRRHKRQEIVQKRMDKGHSC